VRLGVVGLGLIGTSIVLAARRAWPQGTIVGLDRGHPLDALREVDTVVLATPVDVIGHTLVEHAALLSGRALVMDTGSTKRAILSAARAAGLANLVGGHPMAGGSTSGPGAARADLFDGKPWFLIPAHADAVLVDRARDFVTALGARPVVMTDDGAEHDRVMAAVSHLPQVVASALMIVVAQAAGERGLAWAGGGLRDTTRLAQSEAAMWESVLATNAAELRPLIVQLADDLRDAAGRLDDGAAMRTLFERANQYRRALD
jgi:prephenate dehydrogenase